MFVARRRIIDCSAARKPHFPPWYTFWAWVGVLIETDRRGALATGYLIGAGLMLAAAATELFFGVDSERKALEEVASPLSVEDPSEPEA
jgi:hypothetical protein